MNWLSEMYETSALFSAVLSIIHPDLYRSGRTTMLKLTQQNDLHSALLLWPSVFNAVTVLSNRSTPLHRDNKSRAAWYDLLATIGQYEGAVMNLPGIGLKLAYGPGTVIGMAGKVIQHGVSDCDGDRVCLAYYMRDKVHERMETEAAQWMKSLY
jgi:hypothetical protein